MSSKVIITGANGLTGSHMIDYLMANTDAHIYAVIYTDNNLTWFRQYITNKRFQCIYMDLSSRESIYDIIHALRPDYFINFGGITFVSNDKRVSPSLIDINSISVQNILNAVIELAPNCRVFSTGSVEELKDELSAYGLSKKIAHDFVDYYRSKFKDLYVVHGLLSNHESYRRNDKFLTRKITKGVAGIKLAIEKGENFNPILVGNVQSERYWGYAPDFVGGIWKMLNQEKPVDHLLCSNKRHSVKEWIEQSFKAADIKGEWNDNRNYPHFIDKESNKPLVEISIDFYRPEVSYPTVDNRQARHDLQWEPTKGLKKICREMVNYDIENYGKD